MGKKGFLLAIVLVIILGIFAVAKFTGWAVNIEFDTKKGVIQFPGYSEDYVVNPEEDISNPSNTVYCGNNICENGESSSICPSDCPALVTSYCGDGSCNDNENVISCSQDCGINATCGNGICEVGEDNLTCLEDCINSTINNESEIDVVEVQNNLEETNGETNSDTNIEVKENEPQTFESVYSGPTHSECTNEKEPQCVIVKGEGRNECSTNIECKTQQLSPQERVAGNSGNKAGIKADVLDIILKRFLGLLP